MNVSSRIFLAPLLLAAGLFAQPAAAAESYDNCTDFIDSLPATIGTQGTWCLRKNLGTNITSGNAITIATNNVTIDCNHFKIGGLAAGNASQATGIHAENRQNATVRQCNVRGFLYGIHLSGTSGAGYLVEDNRLDNNLYTGIYINGDNSQVLRNAVYDTGGVLSHTTGIRASGNIIGNTVSGVFADVSPGTLHGIYALGRGAQIHDNQVSGLDPTASEGGSVGIVGIRLNSAYQRASGNHIISGTSLTPSAIGIYAVDESSFCLDNTVGGFANSIHTCTGAGNETRP